MHINKDLKIWKQSGHKTIIRHFKKFSYCIRGIIIETTVDLFEVSSDSNKYYITIIFNHTPQRFEPDSGIRLCCPSWKYFYAMHLNHPIEDTNICFWSFSDHIIKLIWKDVSEVSYNNRTISSFEIVEADVKGLRPVNMSHNGY